MIEFSEFILDSERSDGCIDITMMCIVFLFFFVCVKITCRNNVSILNFGILSGFRWLSEYS